MMLFSPYENNPNLPCLSFDPVNEEFALVTGLNGCGKSRLFQFIRDGHYRVEINGVEVGRGGIILINRASMDLPDERTVIPGPSEEELEADAKDAYRMYEAIRRSLIDPDGLARIENSLDSPQSGITYSSLVRSCREMSSAFDCGLGDLSWEHFRVVYRRPARHPFSFPNLGWIFADYERRLERNEFNEWRTRTKGGALPFIRSEHAERVFGKHPRLLLQSQLDALFPGKFILPVDSDGHAIRVHGFRLDVAGDSPSGVIASALPSQISDGERTALWLIGALFTAEYLSGTADQRLELILLDEVDAFLHPKLIQELFGLVSRLAAVYGARVLMSTHSPTTVALGRAGSHFVLAEKSLRSVTSADAISRLTFGVPRLLVNLDTARVCFVEGITDREIYSALFDFLGRRLPLYSEWQDIEVAFEGVGARLDESCVDAAIRSVFQDASPNEISAIVERIRSNGSSSRVRGTVKSLMNSGMRNVCGIVDWDLKANPDERIVVAGYNSYYTLENAVWDPASTYLALHSAKSVTYPIDYESYGVTAWIDGLNSQGFIQHCASSFIHMLFQDNPAFDCDWRYLSGIEIKLPSVYLRMPGHELEEKILRRFSELGRYRSKGITQPCVRFFKEVTLDRLAGKLIPRELCAVLEQVMRSSSPTSVDSARDRPLA